MNRLGATALLLMVSACCMAQVNYPFPHQNASWGHIWSVYNVSNGNISFNTTYVSTLGDTMINDTVYIKTNSAELFLREANDRKVWLRQGNIERLLYDFDAEAGDTVEVFNLDFNIQIPRRIDSVGLITLNNGQTRKIWYTNRIEEPWWPYSGGGYWNLDPVVWIEGIGSNAGLFQPAGVTLNDAAFWLSCFKIGDTLVYGEACVIVDVQDVPEPARVVIFPNPSNGHFTIHYNHQAVDETEITIINNLGQIVHRENIETQQHHLRLHHLPIGMYTVQFRNTHQAVQTKLMIQR